MDRLSHKPLFGGFRAWIPQEWTSVDDRVRGGSSHSSLDCSPQSPVANFHGILDISTLGGAGFASQRTVKGIGPWDLSDFYGLEITLDGESDGKLYTIILKSDPFPKPPGEERSTTSWEYDFRAESEQVRVKWDDFKPTYRGKPDENASPLDLSNITSLSIMARSFFGEQQGGFSLRVVSIAAFRFDHSRDTSDSEASSISNEKPGSLETREPEGWLGRLLGCFRC